MGEEDIPRSRIEALVRGLPGHPLHPPLTDATIGMFVFATAAAVVGFAGAIEDKTGPASWLALIAGLGVALPTAATGFVDWLYLEWGSARWRTATLHLTAMLSAVTLFALAAWRQYPGYQHGDVTTGGLALSLAGLMVLVVGGGSGAASSSCTGCACYLQPTGASGLPHAAREQRYRSKEGASDDEMGSVDHLGRHG